MGSAEIGFQDSDNTSLKTRRLVMTCMATLSASISADTRLNCSSRAIWTTRLSSSFPKPSF
jgi:hypothetical protein